MQQGSDVSVCDDLGLMAVPNWAMHAEPKLPRSFHFMRDAWNSLAILYLPNWHERSGVR